MNYIDNRLGTLIHTVGEDLLLTDQHWNSLDEHHQVTVKMEWLNDMHEIEGLERDYRRGKMTPGQEDRYRRVKATLTENLHIVRKLDLDVPDVPLDQTTKASA